MTSNIIFPTGNVSTNAIKNYNNYFLLEIETIEVDLHKNKRMFYFVGPPFMNKVYSIERSGHDLHFLFIQDDFEQKNSFQMSVERMYLTCSKHMHTRCN